jgi:ferredoxin
MGGGFGVAAGLVNCELFTTQGGEEVRDPLVVAFAGDSTFFHSSVIRMLDGAANRVPCLYLVFDNKTVALTGLQPVPALPIVELAEAAGVQARVVNSFDVWGSSRAFGEALELVRREKKPMLVVGEGECALLPRAPQITSRRYAVWEEKCDGCGMCVEEFRCPALVRGNVSPSSELGVVSAERARESGEMPKPQIVADICVGCGVCEMVCRYSLTVEGKPREEGAIGPVSTPSTSVEGSSACPPQLGVRSGTQGTRPSTLNSKSSFNIALVGVGGLGLREVAEVIIRAAQSAGHGVVRGFVKGGISERFGAVYGIIRVGSGARTPSLLPGEADVVLALEPLEGLRACEGDLRAPSFASAMRTSIAVSTLTLPPLAVTLGQKRYPLLEEILRVLEEKCAFVEVVSPPVEFQRRPLAHNSYFLGAACHLLEEVIPVERVRKAVVELMPSGLTAFDAGRGGYVGGDRR